MKRQETEQETEQEQEKEHTYTHSSPTGQHNGTEMQFKFRRIRASRIQPNGNASVLCPRQKNDHNRRTDDVGTRLFLNSRQQHNTTPPLNTVFNTVNSFAHLPTTTLLLYCSLEQD
jgi:hypothetical protein